MDVFNLSGLVDNALLSYWLSKALLIFLCVAAVCVATRIVKGALRRSKLERGVAGFLRSAITAVLWVIVVIIVADSFGIPTASLLAALGVAGLALSLSVQSLLTNLFAGVQIISAHPFAVGDFVELAGVSGTVAEIRLFQTRLKTPDNRVVIVPNGKITAGTITNYSAELRRRADLRFPVAVTADSDVVRSAILSAAAAEPRALDDPAPLVFLDSLADGRAEYILRVWARTPEIQDVQFALNEAVPRALRERGVEIARRSVSIDN